MYKDEIIEAIHKNRAEYAESFNYDLDAIFQDLKNKQKVHTQKIVKLPIKQKSTKQKAIAIITIVIKK